jgi:hypothetical protein
VPLHSISNAPAARRLLRQGQQPTEQSMSLDDLKCRYEELRDALEQAYLAPVWDSERIDRLADAIRSVELALGAQTRCDLSGNAAPAPRMAE